MGRRVNRVTLLGSVQGHDLRFLPGMQAVLTLKLLTGTKEGEGITVQVDITGRNTEQLSQQLRHQDVLLIEGALLHKRWDHETSKGEKLLVRSHHFERLDSVNSTWIAVDDERYLLLNPQPRNEVELVGLLDGPILQENHTHTFSLVLHEVFGHGRHRTTQHIPVTTHCVSSLEPLKPGMKVHVKGELQPQGPLMGVQAMEMHALLP